jgi:hypothetical protein
LVGGDEVQRAGGKMRMGHKTAVAVLFRFLISDFFLCLTALHPSLIIHAGGPAGADAIGMGCGRAAPVVEHDAVPPFVALHAP